MIFQLLFLLLFLLEGGKILLRKRAGQIVNSPMELLMFFPVVSVPLLPHEFIHEQHLLTVAGKSIILFVAYKLILLREASRNRKIIAATAVALIALTLKSLA